jgi:hypothetical protein
VLLALAGWLHGYTRDCDNLEQQLVGIWDASLQTELPQALVCPKRAARLLHLPGAQHGRPPSASLLGPSSPAPLNSAPITGTRFVEA